MVAPSTAGMVVFPQKNKIRKFSDFSMSSPLKHIFSLMVVPTRSYDNFLKTTMNLQESYLCKHFNFLIVSELSALELGPFSECALCLMEHSSMKNDPISDLFVSTYSQLPQD